MHFFIAITLLFFSPSKKKRHRIKRERAVLGIYTTMLTIYVLFLCLLWIYTTVLTIYVLFQCTMNIYNCADYLCFVSISMYYDYIQQCWLSIFCFYVYYEYMGLCWQECLFQTIGLKIEYIIIIQQFNLLYYFLDLTIFLTEGWFSSLLYKVDY